MHIYMNFMCAFVCGLSEEEIIVFVLHVKGDAWYKSTIFLTMCICAFSLIMHMRRDNKKTRMRFWAQTGDLGLKVEKNNEGHF